MNPDVEFGTIAVKHEFITERQHDKAWRLLRRVLKSYQGDKRPRLVDVLVQKGYLTRRGANRVEKARLYHHARLRGKLFGRIAIKSGFCEMAELERALKRQKKGYLEGRKLSEVGELLVGSEKVSEGQARAISSAMSGLVVDRFLRQGDEEDAASAAESESAGSEEVSEDEIESSAGDDYDSEVTINLDDDDESDEGSQPNEESVEEVDADIDEALSGLDASELEELSSAALHAVGSGSDDLASSEGAASEGEDESGEASAYVREESSGSSSSYVSEDASVEAEALSESDDLGSESSQEQGGSGSLDELELDE